MLFTDTKLPAVHIIELEPRVDERGFFARVWCADEMQAHGLNPVVAQANTGFTHRKGSLRGLHYQLPPHQEAKLVRCIRGAVFDVAVDLRPESPTYCQWLGVELSEDNHRMVYVPEGCAHGYQTLRDNTALFYQTSAAYAPGLSRGVRYDDAAFGIEWPLAVTRISSADLSWPDYRREADATVSSAVSANR